MKQRQEYVQDRFFDAYGARVDQILMGHGTSTTGNLVRRGFKDPAKLAEVLELDRELVENIALILLLFKSKEYLNLDELEKFCKQTNKRHFEKYDWAKMSPTVHKLLNHSCQIARKFPMPLAYYSEEASEACHKFFRKNMINHARQNNKKSRLLDVYNRAVYLSDPKISMVYLKGRLKKHKIRKLPVSANRFLINAK